MYLVAPDTARGGKTISNAAVSLKYWEIIADNLSKVGWRWHACQPLIPVKEKTDPMLASRAIKPLEMRNQRYSDYIEEMLDVMLCLPRSASGLVLIEVEKKIGTGALQKIILRVCDESGSHILREINTDAGGKPKRHAGRATVHQSGCHKGAKLPKASLTLYYSLASN